MRFSIARTNLKEILPLRNLFLQENNFQIRYNACHERGWTDSYLILFNNEKIGYGSVKGKESSNSRDTVFEFYIIPPFRNKSSEAFAELLHASESSFIECQSNDKLLTSLLYEYATDINSDVILFEDNISTNLSLDKIIFRKRMDDDTIFGHQSEPVGNYVLESGNEITATGGFLLHYNFPFADLYMEVQEGHRRKGLGSYLIQEIKKQCYISGRIPAARCDMNNIASKATLIKAGFKIAGYMLQGKIKNAPVFT